MMTKNGGNDLQLVLKGEKERALQEAKECLEMIQAEQHFVLDGFNLLGVVASPSSRHSNSTHSGNGNGSMHASSRHATTTDETNATATATANGYAGTPTPTSSNGVPPLATPATTATATTTATSATTEASYFTEAAHSIEYTLLQVTEQIENLNLFLEELSRHYLGDDGGESLFLEYYYQEQQEEPPRPIPTELANLQLTTLQLYLEECGVLAHTFSTTNPVTIPANQEEENEEDTKDDDHHPKRNGDASHQSHLNMVSSLTMEANDSFEDSQDLSKLPPVFANPDFDLTDPTTFLQLLVGSESLPSSLTATTTKSPKPNAKPNAKPKPNSLYQPTSELFPLIHQDAFASSLDNVELALQDQVRQKAGVFFQETVRFRQLQVAIVALLEQVQELRTFYRQLKHSYAHVADNIDACDYQRQQLERLYTLLEAANELVRCKSSISGLVSANDPLGAAEQIHYGRKLLKGEANNNNNGTDKDKEHSIELQQLVALQTCDDQFTQYETLVVQNLSEELVELFLNWKPQPSNSSGVGSDSMVQDMVSALLLCQALPTTGQLYIRRLQQLIRMTVRTTIAEFVEQQQGGVTGMTQLAFSNCLDLLLYELTTILLTAHTVDQFCVAQEIFSKEASSSSSASSPPKPNATSKSSSPPKLKDRTQPRWTWEAVTSAADLALKSIAELLRLRKEAHSLLKLDEMKELWDTCLNFTLKIEEVSDSRATGLRSTLVGQAKAFLDRTHESNMSALMAALDLERWTQCEVSSIVDAMWDGWSTLLDKKRMVFLTWLHIHSISADIFGATGGFDEDLYRSSDFTALTQTPDPGWQSGTKQQ
jgi:vacuolar protein sorting-associated protein 54